MATKVTYVNLQIAMYIGYMKIYLLAMGHTNIYVRDENDGTFRNGDEPSKNYGDMYGVVNVYITAKQYDE